MVGDGGQEGGRSSRSSFRNVLGNLVNYYLFDKINRKGKVEESI